MVSLKGVGVRKVVKTASSQGSRKSSRPKASVSYKEINESDVPSKSSGVTSSSRSIGIEATIHSKRQPIPTKNSKGVLVFKDSPMFRPNMTPKEVLHAGSFGGTYFRSIYSSVTGEKYQGSEVIKEFPSDWFDGLNLSKMVLAQTYDKSRNTYKADCGGDLNMWESSGWMAHIDPYGWFQWYCRFYMGRRSSDDARQISRGNGVMGTKGRWRNQLCNRIVGTAYSRGIPLEDALNDVTISPKIRQLLQHWGYRLSIEDVEAAAKK